MVEKFTTTDIMTVVLPSGTSVDLPVCHHLFSKWLGKLPNFDFGKKPMIEYKGKGIFAELAILGLLQESGWEGVWVETYGGVHFLKDMPSSWKLINNNAKIPQEKEDLLINIWKTGKTTACFDVFVWKDNEIIFFEGKHKGKDRLTNAQLKFIEGALSCGISTKSLIVVEWSY